MHSVSTSLSTNQSFLFEQFKVLCADGTERYVFAEELVKAAMVVTEANLQGKDLCNSPTAVRQFLTLKLQHLAYEVFSVIYLDTQNRVIACEELFRGTINQTAVYPREVAKHCLLNNAAAVIFYHNHPSGCNEPSRADQLLTQTLKTALSLLDIDVLDHIIIARQTTYSFAEQGQL